MLALGVKVVDSIENGVAETAELLKAEEGLPWKVFELGLKGWEPWLRLGLKDLRTKMQ